nr:7129_t:CDS:2 [Entrophospora candida]
MHSENSLQSNSNIELQEFFNKFRPKYWAYNLYIEHASSLIKKPDLRSLNSIYGRSLRGFLEHGTKEEKACAKTLLDEYESYKQIKNNESWYKRNLILNDDLNSDHNDEEYGDKDANDNKIVDYYKKTKFDNTFNNDFIQKLNEIYNNCKDPSDPIKFGIVDLTNKSYEKYKENFSLNQSYSIFDDVQINYCLNIFNNNYSIKEFTEHINKIEYLRGAIE